CDEDLAEAHAALANTKAAQRDWRAAEHEYQTALSLNPHAASAHYWYGVSCLVPLGCLDDAFEELVLARTLDPVSMIIYRDIARIHFYRREFEAALEQCDCALESDPDFGSGYWMLGLVQEQLGDFDESIAAFRRGIQLVPDSGMLRGALGRILALTGRRSKAEQVIGELEDLAQ